MRKIKTTIALVYLTARSYLFLIAGLALWTVIPLALNWTPTVVISGSMEPTVMTGDVLAAQKVTLDQVLDGAVKPGMVVLADDPLNPEIPYTHRVIEVRPDKSMITRGDANAKADPIALLPENVKGIERLRVPFIGLPTQAIHAGDYTKLILFMTSIIAAILTLNFLKDRVKDESVSDENSDDSDSPENTESESSSIQENEEISKSKKSSSANFIKFFGLATALSSITFALIFASAASTSAAAFTGSIKQSSNSWTASALFPANDPKIARCGGAVYTASTGTALTCSVGTVSGKTTSYVLTIRGTGSLTQWSVTADWSGVNNWASSRVSGTGVSDTGVILTQNGYVITGDKGQGNSSDPRNHAWISSTKAPEVFTVQVTNK